jgi:glycosyltransferase involved in cell wall biosynthesis
MDSSILPNTDPKVSIVIPARNEEFNLERCLRSLVVQKGVTFDVWIVNDDSTDRTRAIAESFTHARQCPFLATNQFLLDVHIIDAPQPLPAGWTGKANALVAAEALVRGQWILFTDADTEHLEDSLAVAVAEAEEQRADLLSFSPEQLLTGVRQQLLMPLIFGELAFRFSPRRVSDPAQPDAAANGQYLLVRAATHRKVGGFASVATSLLEDVALARRYKQQGHAIRFRFGRGLVRTRMYNSWDDLRVGWTKNLALLFPDALELARKRSSEFYMLVLALACSIFFTVAAVHSTNWLMPFAVALLWLITLGGFAAFYFRVSRAHFPFWPSLLSIFGLPLFASLLRESDSAHQKGSVNWRGRVYSTVGADSSAIASNSK